MSLLVATIHIAIDPAMDEMEREPDRLRRFLSTETELGRAMASRAALTCSLATRLLRGPRLYSLI